LLKPVVRIPHGNGFKARDRIVWKRRYPVEDWKEERRFKRKKTSLADDWQNCVKLEGFAEQFSDLEEIWNAEKAAVQGRKLKEGLEAVRNEMKRLAVV